MENICRLCLRKDGVTEYIYNVKNGLEIADLIKIICPIQIEREDQLPKLICLNCLETISAAYDLREQSIQSEQKLMQKLGIIVKYEYDEEHLEQDCIKTEIYEETDQDYEATEFADTSMVYEDSYSSDYPNLPYEVIKMHECKLSSCKRTFASQDVADEHFLNDHHEVAYTTETAQKKSRNYVKKPCPICFKIFSQGSSLIRHIKSVHEQSSASYILETPVESTLRKERRYRCDYCCATKDSKKDLHNHILWKHLPEDEGNEKKFQCSYCFKFYKKTISLQKHLRFFHNVLPTDSLACDLCDFFTKRMNLLENHMVRTHLLKSIICNVCSRLFDRHSKLRNHQLLHTEMVQELDPNLPQIFTCSLCHINSRDREELYQHLPDHQDAFNEKPIACNQCPNTMITNYNHFVNHTTQFHNRRLTHRCLECNRDFVNDDIFLKHLKAHENRKSMLYDCPVYGCSRKFRTSDLLELHMNEHKIDKRHICPYCGTSIKHRTTFDNHVARHEGKSGKHKCSMCERTFFQLSKLKKHMRTHTNERPFQCHLCTKGFFDSNVLKKHIQRHEGTLVKKFACDYAGCERRFTSNWAKDAHYRTHSGEKPFVCQYCSDRAYALKGDLMKHLKQHIGELVHMCEHPGCGEAFKTHKEKETHKEGHRV